MDKKTEEELSKNNNELLVKIADVYNFIKASEATKTISTYNFDDYVDKAIKEIEGPTDNGRPSKLKRLDKIESLLSEISSQLE